MNFYYSYEIQILEITTDKIDYPELFAKKMFNFLSHEYFNKSHP